MVTPDVYRLLMSIGMSSIERPKHLSRAWRAATRGQKPLIGPDMGVDGWCKLTPEGVRQLKLREDFEKERKAVRGKASLLKIERHEELRAKQSEAIRDVLAHRLENEVVHKSMPLEGENILPPKFVAGDNIGNIHDYNGVRFVDLPECKYGTAGKHEKAWSTAVALSAKGPFQIGALIKECPLTINRPYAKRWLRTYSMGKNASLVKSGGGRNMSYKVRTR